MTPETAENLIQSYGHFYEMACQQKLSMPLKYDKNNNFKSYNIVTKKFYYMSLQAVENDILYYQDVIRSRQKRSIAFNNNLWSTIDYSIALENAYYNYNCG